MASISKEIVIDASAERVWEALRDWGGLHVRLVPGFATDARLDGEDRIVRFFNGSVLRERLVNLDVDALLYLPNRDTEQLRKLSLIHI